MAYKQLTDEQRYDFFKGYSSGWSFSLMRNQTAIDTEGARI